MVFLGGALSEHNIGACVCVYGGGGGSGAHMCVEAKGQILVSQVLSTLTF